MSQACEHQWAEHWFTVSAQVLRDGRPSFAVVNARLERCSRCEEFLLSKEVIAQRLFHAVAEAIIDVGIRATERDHPG